MKYLKDDVYMVSDLGCMFQYFLLLHEETICPDVGVFFVSVLNDVKIRSCACLMPTSDFWLFRNMNLVFTAMTG